MKPINHLRRRLVQGLSVTPWLTACQSQVIRPATSLEQQAQRKGFEGIGLMLVVDAVPGAEMEGVEFFADERVRPIYHSAGLSQRNRSLYDFGGPVPLKVRVVWRKERVGAQLAWGTMHSYDDYGRYLGRPGVYIEPLTDEAQQIAKRQLVSKNTGVPHYGPWGSDYRSELAGDYTVDVAMRIPDEVVRDLRSRRGLLRLKFRLKPDGVLFGWDIERDGGDSGYVLRYDLPGGDFNAARRSKTLPFDPGWEIKPDGTRVVTDY